MYRILMVAPTSFFSDYGCHVRILEESRILQKLGHKVTIATYYKGRDLADLELVRTRAVPWREEYEVGSSRHKIGFDALLAWTSLKLALRRRFDVVHAHLHEGALIGGVLARLQRIPLVFDFQGSMTAEMMDHGFLNRDGFWYRPTRWLEDHINPLAHAILTSSQHSARLLEHDFGIDSQKIHAVPDAVNLDFFTPTCLSPDERVALKRSLGIPPERPTVVYLGLLTEYQGTGKLLHAAAELQRREMDAHFLIMGYPSVAHYQQMALHLGLGDRVTFTGKIPYEQAPRYLALGDIAAAPKESTSESNGKILNYMAMELPTVALDVPVSREFLGAFGTLAESSDPRSLADAIQTLLEDPDKAELFGRRSRERAAQEFSWKQAGPNIVSIYDRLCERAGMRHPFDRPNLPVSHPRTEHQEGERL
jgi:glycosyltransferase involved in cell wall biosynthesis